MILLETLFDNSVGVLAILYIHSYRHHRLGHYFLAEGGSLEFYELHIISFDIFILREASDGYSISNGMLCK